MSRIGFYILLIILSCACQTKYEPEKEELYGEWRTSEMYINGDDSEIPFNTQDLIIMGLNEDFFFYNFSSGDWEVNQNILSLYHGDNIFREYIIKYFDSDSLVLEAEIPMSEMFFSIETIDPSEIVTLEEHFIKK